STTPSGVRVSCRFCRFSGSKSFRLRNATSTQNSVSSGPALPLNESLGLNFSKLSSNDSTFAGSSFSAPASFPARSSVMGITAAAVEVGTFRTDADIPFRITLITGIALLLWRVLQNHPDSGRVISDDPVWEAHGVPGAVLSPAEIQQHLRALSRNLPESHHPRAGLHAARSPLLPNEHDHFLISRLHIPDSKSTAEPKTREPEARHPTRQKPVAAGKLSSKMSCYSRSWTAAALDLPVHRTVRRTRVGRPPGQST